MGRLHKNKESKDLIDLAIELRFLIRLQYYRKVNNYDI